jgi:preprotein translocase subunit YajC
VTLFLAQGDIVVGFAIFHIAYSKKKKKREKKRKKRHSSMECEYWWAPDGIG